MVYLTTRANVLALCQHRSTIDVGKFEWLSIFMHWNIGQYRVLMNSISSMLPKCRLNVQVPAIPMPPPPPFEPMAPWTFTPPPNAQVRELVIFLTYIQSILPKTVSYTLVNQIMCSITLHQPLWEHLRNRRAGRGTHLSKGSSMTIRTIVGITPIISRLREMCKSWYEFSFISCMCISTRQCGWLLLDDVMTCLMYRKYLWMFLDNVDYFYSQMWCMFVDSHVYVCCLWILMCGWYCLSSDKYSVCEYMILCVVTRGGKHIGTTFGPW
jgi:hypothetical protein